MTLRSLSFASKVVMLSTGLFLFISADTIAQKKPKPPPSFESFLNTQWWLGIRMGTTLTNPTIESSRYALSPIDYSNEDQPKEYETFSRPGIMAGIDIIFYHRGLSIGFQPNYKNLNYNYQLQQSWLGTDGNNVLENDISVEQDLHYVELPFMIKYDVVQNGKVRPFVQVGWQYSLLMDAQQSTQIQQRDLSGSSVQEYLVGEFRFGNQNGFSHFHGVLGGIGVNLDYLNIRTILEVNYHYGLQNINTSGDPFRENELVALGVVQDDLSLDQINATVSFVFPLRYIDRSLSPY